MQIGENQEYYEKKADEVPRVQLNDYAMCDQLNKDLPLLWKPSDDVTKEEYAAFLF